MSASLNASKASADVSRTVTDWKRLGGRWNTCFNTVASAHTSESNAVPPASTTPTMVHALPPKRTVLPRSKPLNAVGTFLPTTSSASPGRNIRPATSCTVGRTSSAFGETPRTCVLPSVSPRRIGNAATTTTSGLTSGPMPGARATPGTSSITRTWSTGTPLSISLVEPARRTMALRAEPDATSVASKPRASDSIATNTPTVPAMPRIATTVDVHRARSDRRL